MEIINNPGPAIAVWAVLKCVEMDNLGDNSNRDHKLITGVFKLMPHLWMPLIVCRSLLLVLMLPLLACREFSGGRQGSKSSSGWGHL